MHNESVRDLKTGDKYHSTFIKLHQNEGKLVLFLSYWFHNNQFYILPPGGTFHSKTKRQEPDYRIFQRKADLFFFFPLTGLCYLTKWCMKLFSNFSGCLRSSHLNDTTCTFPLSLSCSKGEINTDSCQVFYFLLTNYIQVFSAKCQDVCDRVIFTLRPPVFICCLLSCCWLAHLNLQKAYTTVCLVEDFKATVLVETLATLPTPSPDLNFFQINHSIKIHSSHCLFIISTSIISFSLFLINSRKFSNSVWCKLFKIMNSL